MFPNYGQFIAEAWGWGPESAVPFSAASNVVVGTNPAYSVGTFLSFYPKFGGTPLLLTGIISVGAAQVTGLQTTAGLMAGQALCPYIPLNGNLLPGSFPDGTVILSVDSDNQITASKPASAAGNQIAVYSAPFVPMVVMSAYAALASASLSSARWCEMWSLAMSLYVAHFCTLYLRSDGDTYSTPGQAALAGLSRGIQVSKAAGGVSVGIQPSTNVGGLESWGHWTETTYGVQFATMARIIGSGPMLIY